MSTDSNNGKYESGNSDTFNEDLKRLFSDPELFEKGNSENEMSDAGASSGKKRASLASHHRSHHHHHSHSSGESHHHSSNHSSEYASFDAENTDDVSADMDTTKMAGDITIESNTSKDVSGESRRRIPLAAHHRSHRHRSSGEHHHSSRHSSRRRRATREEQYEGNAALKGQGQTLNIDRGEMERFSREPEKTIQGQNLSADAVQTTETKLDTDILKESSQSNKIEEEASQPRLASTIVAAHAANPRGTRKASSVESTRARFRRKRGKKPTVFQVISGILLVLVVLLVGGIGAFLIMRVHGQSSMTPDAEDVVIVMPSEEIPEEVEEVEDDGKTITYKGEKYRYNENITTILFMGTDRTVEQQESGMTMAGKNGQADTILLGVIDNTNKKISFININRDTYIPVAEYTYDGDYAGEKKMQICLSYSYGRDNEEGCRYTAEAVSKYLYGMPVNAYARISYDAIPILNDSVGGVTVTVLEDMTRSDASLVKGANVTLVGSQALKYVRNRDIYIVETNEKRMARQKQYLVAFMKRAIEATREDVTLPLGLYANATPYMTTNITTSQVTYLTSKVLEYGIADDAIHTIPGKSVEGDDGYIQYNPDQTALYETVLDTFYNKVK